MFPASRRPWSGICIAVLLVAGGTALAQPKEETQPGPQPEGTRPLTSLANPASKNCIDEGGRLEIEKTDKGEIGICVFADGSRCEEWDLLRGRCSPK